LRRTGLWPHPCRVIRLGPENLLSRPARLFEYIADNLIRRPSFLIFAIWLAVALPYSPQAKKAQAASKTEATSSALAPVIFAQLPYQGSPAEIPQDMGQPGLHLQLRRLATTARLMQTVAHPDDEDGGMLTLESRGHGANVLLMTLNRGEGGQNKVGSNLSDVLGVLRTLELLASDEYYGVQERFSRVADFGFSKSADETFAKWNGHDVALADMVRVIRTFRPDVLVARFSGTSRDGHGHHQASSLLTQEAFRAAADPKRFPDQIAAGLPPWQAQKLYIGNVCGFGAMTCPDANWTVKLNTGQSNPDLGESYVQFAMEGLRHQQSQGAANWNVDPGDRFTFYKLVDSVEPPKLDKDGHEKDFFDGIDTTLPGLASRLGAEESKLPQLRHDLTGIANQIADATQRAKGDDLSSAVDALIKAAQALQHVQEEIEKSGISGVARLDLTKRLEQKRQEVDAAVDDALNVTLSAVVIARADNNKLEKEADATTTVSPGQDFLVAVTLRNGSKNRIFLDGLKLEVPSGWGTLSDKTRRAAIKPGDDERVLFRLHVPKDATYTRPYWHRDDPETESLNRIDEENYATLPFPPPPLTARAQYSLAAELPEARIDVGATVATEFLNEGGKPAARPLAIVPAFSVALEPGTQAISTNNGSTSSVTVGVTGNLDRNVKGALRLELPQGWRSDPDHVDVDLARRGEKKDFEFKVFPAGLREERTKIRAVLEADGNKFSEGYTLVDREDLGSFYYYQPALQRVSIVDVKAPHDLKVGYVMGAGDDIPTVLKQVGMNVSLIAPEKLGNEDLSQYGTIVLGIRAYDTQKEVAANNQKLLDFVSAGGTLVVQYNAGTSEFNSGHFTPYPAELSRARVSVEDAPVEILAPQNDVFHTPNEISARDFDGWVQERGLYFMSKWDDHFKPLLACHDPGEDPQKGGLLEATYGKGIYIYTGYAFFRQLPAGVPGAVRFYVNLLSAGHSKQQ